MKKKLKGFKAHEKISRKRIMIPAVRITENGYFILNAPFVKQIGESLGGFSMQFFYSKSQKSIAIQFKKIDEKNIEPKELPKLKTPRWILCARDFLKSSDIEYKIDRNKFYPIKKILEAKKEQTWVFRLQESE